MKLTRIARSLAVASVLAFGAVAGTAVAQSGASLTAEATNRYFVYFDEAGALHYQGNVAGLERTAAPGGEFDARTANVVAYRDYLAGQRQQYISDLNQALGRTLEVTYEYDIFFNGVVVENLSASEAALLAKQPGVSKVEVVKDYELATDRVEQFIGAGAVWTGTSTPDPAGSRGAGAVIAVIDTGVNTSAGHGSFQNDASCGHSASQPKLIAKDCIGSSTCAGSTPNDSGHPHGSHTASTAGGNTHAATGGDLVGTQISGVAPCARLVTYKACPGQTCDGAALQAAAQTIMVDRPTLGITTVNYSISGGNSPWNDMDRNFLDMVDAGIFVAASAGNTSDTIPNPIGQVAHRGPWVATVANSTHDRISSNPVSVAGGPTDVPAIKSEATFAADVSGQIADAVALGNPLGCTAGGGFAAGSMTGKIALISRGDCTFEEKSNNAIAAGAVGIIVHNNNAGPPIVMGGTAGHSAPSVMVSLSNGEAIRTFVGTNPTALATIDSSTTIAIDPESGDVLSSGSLRGPVPASLEVTKPDITGPGTNIFAAYNLTANAYGFMSGTSMSGPHVAGAGALLKTVQPTWTNPEVKSAIQMTAFKDGLKDFTNGTPNNGPWDADDVGHGRVDLTKAALAGLVLNETTANFLAANGNVANQRALNLASMRNTSCTPSCTWTRTVRNTLDVATSWTAAGASSNPNLAITVSPASFSFTGDPAETQELTITATPNGNLTAAVAFGEVVLTEASDESPELHLTVAIRGQGAGGPPVIAVDPTSISATGTAGSTTPVVRPLEIANNGGSDLTWSEGTTFINARGTATVVWDQPESGTQGIVSDYYTTQATGAYTANDFVLAADTDVTEIFARGFDNSNALASQTAITWHIYADDGGAPAGDPENNASAALWTFSAAPSAAGVDITDSDIRLDLAAAGADPLELTAGTTYWLTVFATYPDSTLAPRWNWAQGDPVVGAPSKLISPVLFGGVADWTEIGALTAGAISETAFTLSGIQGEVACGAPWLSIDPTSGTVAPAGSEDVAVELDPSTLAVGTHTASLCIESNDPANATVIVPVSFEVTDEPAQGEADLALTVTDLPDPVGQGAELTFMANVTNFGPDAATEVEVVFELPAELSYSRASSVQGVERATVNAVRGTAGEWSCAGAGTVTCVLDGTLDSGAFAPVLEVITQVSATAAPGIIDTVASVASAQTDPNAGNNEAVVETEITGEVIVDAIFCDGFEDGGDGSCSSGGGTNPDIVDSGPLSIVIEVGGDIGFNIVTGETGLYDEVPGADINLYDYGNGELSVYYYADATPGQGGVIDAVSEYSVLQSGDTVGPDAEFLGVSKFMVNWNSGVEGYLGVTFFNESTNAFNYGYLELESSAPIGLPLTIKRAVYNQAGDPITIP